MIARGAQWNPSAFRKEGLAPFEETVRAYIKKVRIISLQNSAIMTLNLIIMPKRALI
jgi:tRNA-dihydrouridine synthase